MSPRKPTKRKVKAKVVTKEQIEDVIQRIQECEIVVDELESSPTWKILITDIELQKQQLDDNWQTMTDEQLDKARPLKFSAMHILTLKDAYAEELKQRRTELKTYQNQETEMIKDYDTEGVEK